MHTSADSTSNTVSLRRIAGAWWPLAASWLLMAVEGPALSAVVARLPDPKIHLAAYGSVVWPLVLIIEAPILMLLAASTALSKDWQSYVKVRRFMIRLAAALTALHVLVAFTPLSRFVIGTLIGAPAEIIEPAVLGLRIMTPFSGAVAYRRFNQGVLIRFGYSRSVGLGTLLRLLADGLMLAIGYNSGGMPGVAVASAAITAGVIAEAAFVGLRVRPILRDRLRTAETVEPPLTWRGFLDFYIPLAMTSLLALLMQPIGSAGVSRMPNALESLAAWPVVSGLVFMFRSAGMAYNEVVVALLDEPGAWRNLNRFTGLLAALVTGILLLIAATPLSEFWFRTVSGLPPSLADLAHRALWFALPLPALNALYSWYQGSIVHSRRTRGITEAVAIYLGMTSALLAVGVVWGQAPGIFIAWGAIGIGTLVQTIWLWHRSRPAMKAVRQQDAA